MYGEHTVVIDLESKRIVDSFHGQNKSFQDCKNTSFSALGRLKKQPVTTGETLRVTLFENVYAKVPIDYTSLPACFEVISFERPAE